MGYFFNGYFLYFFIFAAYLELSPSLGNIYYRIGEDGMKHMQLINLFYFMIEPLYKPFLWNIEYLDLNYFVGGFIFSIIISLMDQ